MLEVGVLVVQVVVVVVLLGGIGKGIPTSG